MVEAKNENLMSGIGQCLATMVAARCFNTQADGVTMILAQSRAAPAGSFATDGDDATMDLDSMISSTT